MHLQDYVSLATTPDFSLPLYPHFKSELVDPSTLELPVSRNNIFAFKERVKGKGKHGLVWGLMGELSLLRCLDDVYKSAWYVKTCRSLPYDVLDFEIA